MLDTYHPDDIIRERKRRLQIISHGDLEVPDHNPMKSPEISIVTWDPNFEIPKEKGDPHKRGWYYPWR